MENYVTLFDSLFLPQGLALHTSMQRHIKNYSLWILCVDDISYDVLTRLNLSNVHLLQLSKLETSELIRIKPYRSKGEYCWTLSPFAPRFVFEADPSIERVTYLDADIWFRKDPSPIFNEFQVSKKDVLITDHAYTPARDASSTSGQFCVQFMIFNRTGGEVVRKWWENRCIEWCYARIEDGKFGDQKYLDDWPVRFEKNVHILTNKEFTLAPWNAQRFPYNSSIIYHFHALRIVNENEINIGSYNLPKVVIKEIYMKYFIDLKFSFKSLKDVNFIFLPQAKKLSLVSKILNIVKSLKLHFQEIIQSGSLRFKS